MKRPAFIVSIIPLIFISCSSPQSTVTSETTRTPEVVFSATPSNTPEPPTPTPEPTLSPEQQAQAELGVEKSISINGIDLQLGAPDASGNQVIEKFIAPENPTIEQQYALDQLTIDVGFEDGATTWLQTADGRTVLVDAQDHSKEIAEWKVVYRNDTGEVTRGVMWDWSKMLGSDGENILFNVCQVFSAKNGLPTDAGINKVTSDLSKFYWGVLREDYDVSSGFGIYVFSLDGKKVIRGAFTILGVGSVEDAKVATKGIYYFQTKEGNQFIFVKNFKHVDK